MASCDSDFLVTLPDGTVKQRNPFTGVEVWTVPGRGHRPLGIRMPEAKPLTPKPENYCAFCVERLLDTPPEKSRMVKTSEGWAQIDDVLPAENTDTVAEFRRIPNLFEILSADYWRLNHGHVESTDTTARRARYLSAPGGREHILAISRNKLRAAGRTDEELSNLSEEETLEVSSGFFGGSHDVLVARRHFVDGATNDSMLASSGTLSVEEHREFIAFAVRTMKDLYDMYPHARYVSVFQNWLKPAGASFDHLHKQIVAIDEQGTQNQLAIARVRENPNVFNDVALNLAIRNGLLIAENEHAVAFAGFGHRYPTVEIYSKSVHSNPWDMTRAEIDDMSDLIHAMHAATGADVPCNEEWHHRPIGVEESMPWRVMLKWRISTLAGFEGDTKIYLNTIAPSTIRERVIESLRDIEIADGIEIAPDTKLDALRYGKGK